MSVHVALLINHDLYRTIYQQLNIIFRAGGLNFVEYVSDNAIYGLNQIFVVASRGSETFLLSNLIQSIYHPQRSPQV